MFMVFFRFGPGVNFGKIGKTMANEFLSLLEPRKKQKRHVIRVRGLPWSACGADVREIFPNNIKIFNGEAGVHFTLTRGMTHQMVSFKLYSKNFKKFRNTILFFSIQMSRDRHIVSKI